MNVLARLARWTLWLVGAAVVILGGGVLFLTRTDRGATLVVEKGAGFLEQRIRGTLRVDDVSTVDLLDGVTLRGVEIRGLDGRPFVRADSVRADYSVLALLAGDLIFRNVRLWGGRVVVERLPGQDELNVDRILPPAPDTGDTETARRIVLRDVEIEDTEVEVLLPVQDSAALDPSAFTERAPGGGLLRRYLFRGIRADLPRVAVQEPELDGQAVDVRSVSLVAEVVREPVRLVELRGGVRLVGSTATVRAGILRLADSDVSGTFRARWGEDALRLTGDLGSGDVSLADLRWLLPRLPDARARFRGVEFALGEEGSRWDVADAEVRTGESRVEISGGLDAGERVEFRGMRIRAAPLAVDRLEPWLEEPLPLDGRVRGGLTLDGSLDALTTGGELTLEEPGYRPTTARVEGTLRLATGFGAAGFVALVEPLDWRLARIVAPGLKLEGGGSLELELDGRLHEGMAVTADILHSAPGLVRSDVDLRGTVRSDDDGTRLDLQSDVDRLALGALRPMVPDVGMAGEVEGTVRLRGPLRDLRVEAELSADRGRVSVTSRFDATDPADGYELDAVFSVFDFSGLLDGLPEPTMASGTVSARARGLRKETLAGEARIQLGESRFGRLAVDTATVSLRTADGGIRLDTLDAETNLARIRGGGRIGLRSGARDGEIRLTLRNDSMATVQPLIFGERVIAGDTLTALEREGLVARGIDPDTLPPAASVAVDGRVRADVTVRGHVEEFTVEGSMNVEELVYGPNFVQEAEASFTLEGLPELDGRIRGVASTDSLVWGGLRFAGGEVDVEYRRPAGRVIATVRRSPTEDYRAQAAFEVDSVGGVVHLDEVVLRFEPERWNLGGPASVSWGQGGIVVHDFQLVRPGADGMRIRADGRLPIRGEADFELDVQSLDVNRLARLVQTEEEIGGVLDLHVRVGGSAEDPRMEGSVEVDSLRFRNIRMSRASGEVRYRDRRLRGSLEAWRDSIRAARVEGELPADLRFQEVEDRIPAEPMDLSVAVDSFPLVVLATMVEPLEDVRGTVAGDLQIRGTPDDVETGGSFRVSGGAFTLPGLGIRPVEVEGSVTLTRGATARVDLRGRSGGAITVQGTVALAPVSNPTFDLTMQASSFQAVDRRDLSARLSGDATLTGTYRQPAVSGSVRVGRSTLQLEEFERSAQVVDLSDPAFFDVVDTSPDATEPVVGASESPFLQNLRVDVEVGVERDTWLRSRDMNVEMRGQVSINFDRTTEEFVLVGQLSAVRGTYSAFGRQFQVQEGTVEFVGTPGLNPNLNIQAATRVRTSQGAPLTITATVSGTLQEPRVSLSSDAQPAIAQSDLVSYLIFGRPSFALGSGETAVLQGAASQILGAAGSLTLGAVANQLGSVVRETGLADYFAISEAPGATDAAGGTVASTQVEAGWYLRENLFAAVVLRPLAGREAGGGVSRDPVAGARIEWHLGDVWTVESFFEDRFQRSGLSGFGDIGLQTAPIFGFFLYRDWGY